MSHTGGEGGASPPLGGTTLPPPVSPPAEVPPVLPAPPLPLAAAPPPLTLPPAAGRFFTVMVYTAVKPSALFTVISAVP
ncbi:MAG: hypothetical protein Q4G07_10155, partial [Oscillospiraceae bacterium]|nr:hypothetical protein [Oscillospiraceae bacterium]